MALKMAKPSGDFPHYIQSGYQPASLLAQNITKTEQENLFLKKQSGRVIENKGKSPKTKRKQTGNKATEVVENTRVSQKTNRKQTEKQSEATC